MRWNKGGQAGKMMRIQYGCAQFRSKCPCSEMGRRAGVNRQEGTFPLGHPHPRGMVFHCFA